ncbi:RNA polymerase sigma factor SigZ [Candidatus Thiomargarita nelsonii]|uniref:RNA polymerase sigma factor SigZ n=1 Tax=Candidatus Thiomargarita nelsonii TaxID=1003181 RepID=A0A0A6P5I6_9GAMM|nr:RNA polymerase sigma factor SigZ [Candidatus Thiomargarita nelsonii]
MNKTENIWIEYHDKLFFFIKSRVSDSFIAEDILQDVFIKIHTKLDRLDEPRKLRSWLYQITRNTIIDYYRTRQIETERPDWIVEPTQIDTEEIIRQELSSCLAPMINHLPEKYRLAILLSEIEGKTQKEVAKQENISLSGAKSRVQRGRTLLKTILYDCCQLEINKSKQIIDYSVKDKNCKFC